MKTVVTLVCLVIIQAATAQPLKTALTRAVNTLEADTQMESGLLGFYVIDRETGQVVYDRNGNTGFAVASSQKVITSATALELLGPQFRYKTQLAYSGDIKNGTLNGSVYVIGSGDPTLGSWRYSNTKEQTVLNSWATALKNAGISNVSGTLTGYDKKWESQTVPGGWIWDDIGNYYGAGVSSLNWRENQYDLNLSSGDKEGARVIINSTTPELFDVSFVNELKAGKPGSGDNAYIYLPPYGTRGFLRGTIPPAQQQFTISGSFPNSARQLVYSLRTELMKQGITFSSLAGNSSMDTLPGLHLLTDHISPALDSINFFFLRKSINLYGEALVKTLGFERRNEGSAKAGIGVIREFWHQNGVRPVAINIIDGSGLSPQNRVTPQALVSVMKYATTRPWFASFKNALPELNGLKMKSGTIGGAKSFTGYAGRYIFAIVVNNYNGSAGEIVRKLYTILDLLK